MTELTITVIMEGRDNQVDSYAEIDGVADVSPQMPGDVDMNGVVDVTDLLALIANFGEMPIGGPLADFNGDFIIDVSDLLTVIGHWS